MLAWMTSAMATSTARRSSMVLALQAGKAALAAATAWSSWALEARGARPTGSSVAGLSTSEAASPSTSLPSMSILNADMGFPPSRFSAGTAAP
jgi:hypothetical protein